MPSVRCLYKFSGLLSALLWISVNIFTPKEFYVQHTRPALDSSELEKCLTNSENLIIIIKSKIDYFHKRDFIRYKMEVFSWARGSSSEKLGAQIWRVYFFSWDNPPIRLSMRWLGWRSPHTTTSFSHQSSISTSISLRRSQPIDLFILKNKIYFKGTFSSQLAWILDVW